MSTDHRMSVAEAASKMGLRVQDVKLMVFASKLNGGRDQFGMWVDDRAVRFWLDNQKGKGKEDV